VRGEQRSTWRFDELIGVASLPSCHSLIGGIDTAPRWETNRRI